jgi:Protein of unknown function (DUF4242)
MPKYLIERHIPGAGKLTGEDLRGIAPRSNAVLAEMGPQIQWIQSFVTDDAITCVYVAANEELLRQHASRGSFPITQVREVKAVIDPSTANVPVDAGR